MRGVALPGVLLLSAFLVGVSGWLVGHVRTDRSIATMSEADEEAERVAQAAIEMVAMALAGVPDWRPAGAVSVPLSCPAAGRPPVALDPAGERARVQATVDATTRWGLDTPRYHVGWVCHGEGVMGRWPARGVHPAVVVLVADEPEGDGQSGVSQNDRLLLRSVSRAAASSRGDVSATVTRAAAGAPVVIAAIRRGPGA